MEVANDNDLDNEALKMDHMGLDEIFLPIWTLIIVHIQVISLVKKRELSKYILNHQNINFPILCD